MKIYTDGSCLINKYGGWAFCIIGDKQDIISYNGVCNTTNNRMELMAVIEALKYIIDNNLEKYCKIFSDSQLTINCGKKIWKRKSNLDLWDQFDNLNSKISIDWEWVKAHNNNYYNELVDKYARREAQLISIANLFDNNYIFSKHYLFFYKGEFSQFFSCNFIEQGITYNCAEQYMMSKKAVLFKDFYTNEKIMNSNIPYEQKKYGRIVKNFNEKKWNKFKRNIVISGNYLKFSQNPELKEMLMLTKKRKIVECSPTDKIWGIGLDLNNKKIFKSKNWKGTNLLGQCLTKVRKMLR